MYTEAISLSPSQVLQQRSIIPHLHLVCKAIVYNQTVSHLDPVWLHGVPCPIVIVPYFWVIKVGHLLGSQTLSAVNYGH